MEYQTIIAMLVKYSLIRSSYLPLEDSSISSPLQFATFSAKTSSESMACGLPNAVIVTPFIYLLLL